MLYMVFYHRDRMGLVGGQFSTLGWGGLDSGFDGVLDRALVERAVQQRAHVGVHGRQHLVRPGPGVGVRGWARAKA